MWATKRWIINPFSSIYIVYRQSFNRLLLPFRVNGEGAHADASHSQTSQQFEGGNEKYSTRNGGTGNWVKPARRAMEAKLQFKPWLTFPYSSLHLENYCHFKFILMSEHSEPCWITAGDRWTKGEAWGVMTAYGNGECVKFTRIEAWGLLAV